MAITLTDQDKLTLLTSLVRSSSVSRRSCLISPYWVR
jgi:hypothetical protein